MPRDIFISYSQADRDCALELTQHLEAENFGVWIAPRDVSAGADWAAQIIEALSAARVMVLVLSGSSNDSPQVRREVERAVHKKLHILPFRIEDVLPSRSLEYFLSAEHWLDAFPPPCQPYYAQLCAHLKSLLNTAAVTPAAASTTRSARTSASRHAAGSGLDRSVAVLPFVNLSSDPEQEYFSDGLSEELINHLAHVRGLRVIARTSCFAFKGKNEDLRVVGEKLSVGHVLEGSVRKAGNRLRITAQLIDCTDGAHLWSQTFDRDLGDVFAMQDDIARSVAQALGVALGMGDAVPPGGTRNLEAYELHLRARSLERLSGPAELKRAAELYREALALDGEFALAWTGLAHVLWGSTIYLPETSAQARAEWDHSIERALAITPGLWESQLARGQREAYRRSWAVAEQAFGRALQLAPPSDRRVAVYFGLLLASVGRVEDAIIQCRAARAADPLSVTASMGLQITLTLAGRDEEAEKEYLRSRDLAGNRTAIEHMAVLRAFARADSLAAIQKQMRQFVSSDSLPMPVQSQLLEMLEQPEAARRCLRQAFDDAAYQDATRQFRIAVWAAQFEDIDLALAASRRAYLDMKSWVVSHIWLPVFGPMRQDPRFKVLLRDLGIVDYWRQTGQWGDFARPVGEDDFECK